MGRFFGGRPILWIGVSVAVLLGNGCGGDSPGAPVVVVGSVPDDSTVIQPASSNASQQLQLGFQTLAIGFDTPWDLSLSPSGELWVTERRGTVSRVDTSSGQITSLGSIPDVLERSESGLMGMAFHPDFPAVPLVYFVHSYDRGGENIRNRVVRMGYDGNILHSLEVLLDDIPGNLNHNGSRLVVGPDRMLYFSTGDSQAPNLAVELPSLAGKILRIDLDGKVPTTNPFGTEVFSFGHRNPQGLVFHPQTGELFSTEHGPSDNDEVNRIVRGRNHGWPEVHGFCQDEDVPGIAEAQYCRENNVVEPLVAWTPTIAPSGCDFYFNTAIPVWNGSLLMTTLAQSALYRLTLKGDATSVSSQEVLFEGQFGRLRDVLVGPRGEVYLATSNRDGRGTVAGADRIIRIQGTP